MVTVAPLSQFEPLSPLLPLKMYHYQHNYFRLANCRQWSWIAIVTNDNRIYGTTVAIGATVAIVTNDSPTCMNLRNDFIMKHRSSWIISHTNWQPVSRFYIKMLDVIISSSGPPKPQTDSLLRINHSNYWKICTAARTLSSFHSLYSLRMRVGQSQTMKNMLTSWNLKQYIQYKINNGKEDENEIWNKMKNLNMKLNRIIL